MKKLLLFTLLCLIVSTTFAQEKGKFRFGLDLGYVFQKNGGGFMLSLEPKYNITKNSNIGFELGFSASASDENNDNVFTVSDTEDETGTTLGYLVTYDYYFHKANEAFAPFVGAGLGGYHLPDTYLSNGSDRDKFGGFLRAGFEITKFRMAAEYNFIPKSELPSGTKVKNSYFGISVGFFIGGGEWKF